MKLPQLDLTQIRVLIADQQSSVRTWLRTQLALIGIQQASMAANATDLLRHCKTGGFDVVLCDHHLDNQKDGVDLLEDLRYQSLLPLSSVFMIVTGERTYKRVISAVEFAPDDYLIKPFSANDLSHRVMAALMKKQILKDVFARLAVHDYPGVIEACDKVIAGKTHHTLDALRIKAEALLTLERLDEAAEIYASVSTQRAVPWARMGFAMVLQKRGLIDEAAAEATKLNTDCPEFLSVYDFLARTHEQRGDLAAAMEYLERADALSPANTERLRHLGKLASETGDHPRAAAAMRKVVDRTHKSGRGKLDDHLTLMKNLVEENTRKEADERLKTMRNSFSDTPEGIIATEVAIARQRHIAGDTDAANQAIDRALATHQETPDIAPTIAVDLAEVCVDTGRTDDALKVAERIGEGAGSLDASLRRRLGRLRPDTPPPASASVTPPPMQATPPAPVEIPATEAPAESLADEIETARLLKALANALASLDAKWDEAEAAACRELLIDTFSVAPREREVIQAHIRYDRIAARNGADRHKPTTRKAIENPAANS
ncbi:hypothetical protein GCM10025771_10420 [Niveibacterium umoris]|uniref:DNA-binding response OmpR family regulator n=1 Tax=Niveibacterium umoris TaxID=1193620 RepID=A0A840BSS2_9RHOO|nr:response regulator [Niveibacterium umoris]MBB4013407.1 DNA-binding response OmpR family regulator [Niveibacterium umoris]